MKIELRGRAKIGAVVLLFVCVTGIGLLLDKLSADSFTVETYGTVAVDSSEDGLSQSSVLESGSEKGVENSDDNHQNMVINGKININTADKEILVQLHGIGEKTAEKIIAYREEHGNFSDVHELTLVSGIGEKKLEAVIDDICAE